MPEMDELAEKAVESAKDWDLLLDYSAESITSLETLAQMIYKANKSQHLSDQVLLNAAVIYGAYLGETLLRNGLRKLGFDWAETDEDSIVIRKGDHWMSPINKVYKRFINGTEDNLEGFYSFSLSSARGEFELQNTHN